ncbi:MAG: Peptidase family, partial [Thermoleophilaceae bacterium]|nr:Peptidase family [Thermoleophilaceae bacterium]
LHLSAAAVHEGDAVERGERVGAVGTSGRRSATEPHLHFGVRDAGARQAYHDPLAFLPSPAPPAEEPRAPAPAPDEAPAAVPPPPVAVAAPDASPPAVPVGVGVGVGAAVPAGAPAATAAPGLPAHGPSFGHGLWFERALAARHSNSTGAAVLRGEPHRAGAGHAPAHRGHVRGSEPRQGGTRHRALNPAAGPRGVPVQEAAAPPATRRLAAQHPSSSGAHRGGVDLGWLAALIGLVLAAVCLGRPDASARVARRGRDRLGALLRPVGGRG